MADNLSEKLPVTGLPYHDLIEKYAGIYGVDNRLMCAVVKQESRFQENAISEHGAIGLMQVMPVEELAITGESTGEGLSAPRANIKAGVSYFATLMKLFQQSPYEDQIQLALAAYNAGPSRIYDAQEIAAYLGDNPNSWSAVKSSLPLLSKRFYSLHQAVWRDGKPRCGYFGEWRQTLAYVDNVIKTYDEFCAPPKDFAALEQVQTEPLQ